MQAEDLNRFGGLLETTLSPDKITRDEAIATLEGLLKSSFPGYCEALIKTLQNSQTHPGQGVSEGALVAGCLLLELKLRESTNQGEQWQEAEFLKSLQLFLFDIARNAKTEATKRHVSYLLGEVSELNNQTFRLMEGVQGDGGLVKSSEFWNNTFVALTALKPSLQSGNTKVLSETKKNMLETLIKATESANYEENLLAGEIIAEMSKNTTPQLIKPVARLLEKIMSSSKLVDEHVKKADIV